MVRTEPKTPGRFFALRLGVMVALILTFGLFSQIVALAAVFGYAGPAFALAALVVVNSSAHIVTGLAHRRKQAEPEGITWVVRTVVQELILVGGLVGIGLGHNELGWWAAIVYLVWTGCESGVTYGKAELVPRRKNRRAMERRRADAESQVRYTDAAIEAAETIMLGSPDDEDIQSLAQQLRHAAVLARQGALAGLLGTRPAQIQLRAWDQPPPHAAVDESEGSRTRAYDGHLGQPTDWWDGSISDRSSN